MSSPREFWHVTVTAHRAQAQAHRLYAEACYASGKIDADTLDTWAHHLRSAAYYAKCAEEVEANACLVAAE